MLGQSTVKGRDTPWVKLYRSFDHLQPLREVAARADHLSADTGALLLREIMERTGIVEWMTERLVDPRNPHTVSYPLADLLRTNLLLLGRGWRDQDDADRLRHDPSLRVANDTRRGAGRLEQDRVLASQPTMSISDRNGGGRVSLVTIAWAYAVHARMSSGSSSG